MMSKIVFIYINKFKDYPILYEYCTLLKSRGFDVSYIGLGDAAEEFIDVSGVKVFHFPRHDIKNKIEYARSCSSIIKQINPHLVHVFHFRWCLFIPVLLPFSRQFILDVRTVHIANKHGKHTIMSPIKNWLTWFESIFYRNSIALTHSIRKMLNPTFRKIPVIPLGANISRFRPVNDQAAKENLKHTLGIPTEHLILLYSGTLCTTRKVSSVIDAFAALTTTNKKVHLIIAGHDRDNPNTIQSLKDFSRERNVQSKITFTGFVNYDVLVNYYRIADIGLCYIPQVAYYDEQPPTKLFEYLAAGLVVVATETTAIRDILNDGVNGFMSADRVDEFASRLAYAISNYSSCKEKIILNGYRTLEKYNWDYIIDEYLLKYYASLGVKLEKTKMELRISG